GDDSALHLRDQSLHRRFVEAKNGCAVKGDLVQEGQESRLNILEVSVIVEMVRLNVRDDRDGRRKEQEGAVALVGFKDNIIALASLALLPIVFKSPPTTIVGSKPALSRTVAIIDVVVVFPWVPATAMLYFNRASSASISARGITGILRQWASTISGFSA